MEDKNSEDLIYSHGAEPEIMVAQESQEVMVEESITRVNSGIVKGRQEDVEQGQRPGGYDEPGTRNEADDTDDTDEADEADDTDEKDEPSEQDTLSDERDKRPTIKISRSTRVKQELIYKPGKEEKQ
ncbi:hypothetical protein ASZ90_018685 [hydrocarbon metagenome]|uniref:Uncharacterized protein n=1 Tax=hydrocarbon metagenome TaxID=938273 RepID=A0A0W8E690_9ZZZZ